uniref:NYN domain-containing protein n=1 Tax=Tetranychus urticae TaxID=32264 RepID=T1KGJ7_TETUR
MAKPSIIKPHNLNEIFFFCVCDVHKLPSNVGHSLTNVDFQVHNGVADSAAIKIMDLMRKFVAVAGPGCTIILLSGDADYYGTLTDLKRLHNVSIHLIRLADSFACKLDQISDYTFILNNGVLKPIKSTALPMYFISIKNYPLTFNINRLIDELDDMDIESIANSTVFCGDTICLGFHTLCDAESSIGHLNETQNDDEILEAELLADSPLAEILKCINPVQSKIKNEAKQLTFIKMNNSNEADDSKIIKFCIACTLESGSQCILSTKSYLWIVFLFKSDAQKFLPKVQILYPKAFISEPPIDLKSKCLKNPYFVESCGEIVTNGVSSNVTSRDVHNDIDWKIFFRYDCDFIPPRPYYEPTKWSLLYSLFEKLYDLGAKKVILDGNLYCVHFNSVSAYQGAYEKLSSLYLEPLESVDASEAHKLKAAKEMTRYSGIPWCLNEQLDLSCLVIKTDSQFHDHFMDIDKNILGNHECIFVKSIPGEIWICFPDELICKDSEKTVMRFSAILQNNVSMAKPSNELLESINFRDLVGDAYDLAFLSNQLEDLEPIKRPKIIERIKMQRIQEQECNGSIFHFSVQGTFYDRWWLNNLTLEQIVKILVNFSKVIPLAATASYESVDLIYNSWHEAHAARHFMNKLTAAEVSYFSEFRGTSSVQLSVPSNYSEYYIINDKRKVLDKIVQNKSMVDQLDSNSSTVQSTTDIEVKLDEEMMKKTQNFFVITTNSGFKFTSGMLSIIKLNLIQMNCPVCIAFEDKIWVTVDDLEKGKKFKTRIEQIKFKILHEYEDDFEVAVVMKSIQEVPPKVTKMLANKLMNPKESVRNVYLNCDVYPLGHFNYSYRKAVGISTNRYCQLNEMYPPKSSFDISI